MIETSEITATGTTTLTNRYEPSDGQVYVFGSIECALYSCSASGVISAAYNGTFPADNFLYTAQKGSSSQFNMYRLNKYMKEGAYDCTIYCYRYTDRGIATLYIDGSSCGTADMYAASQGVASLTITNFAVTGSKYHTIDLRMDTKNGSASHYTGLWSSIRFYPHT
jgi:hypothetical protein